jgi:hypothetical protein
LELPHPAGSAGLETLVIIERYNYTGGGDPYLESTLFELGRHLFISSERDNCLSTRLAGKWSQTLTAVWCTDCDSNINFQMNHWFADKTGLGYLKLHVEYLGPTRDRDCSTLICWSRLGHTRRNEHLQSYQNEGYPSMGKLPCTCSLDDTARLRQLRLF